MIARVKANAAPAIASAAAAAFLVLATRTITLPGLYYDELIQVVLSLDFVKGGLGSPVAWIPRSQLWLAGHPMALMTLSYMGAVKTVAFIPVAWLFGITPESVRYFSVAVGGISLAFTYAFASRLWGPLVAALAIVLLALDPSFVFYSRVDFGPTVFMMLAKSLALWQLVVWWQTRRGLHLVLAFAALGAGLYNKADFIWFLGALALSAGILVPREQWKTVQPRQLCLACSAFVVAALPLVVWNFSWPPRTWSTLQGLSAGSTTTDASVVDQLVGRGRILVDLLDGRDYAGGLLPAEPRLPIISALFCLGIVALAAQWWFKEQRFLKAGLFALLCTLFVGVISLLAGAHVSQHHVILAYPFPHLLIAAAIVWLVRIGQHRRATVLPTLVVALGVMVLAVSVDLGRVQSSLQTLEESGGKGNWSDAIYHLASYFSEAPPATVVALDWGIHYPLVGLTQGRVHSLDLWLDLNNSSPPERVLGPLFANPGNRYVLHGPGTTTMSWLRAKFFDTAAVLGCRLRQEATFPSRLGQTEFEVYAVGPCTGLAGL